jgi:NAD(P)-dependent dehydrogenase (short-subunit alcohol dehydrogenase family)
MDDLNSATVLVSGGATGLGAAIAQLAADAGAKVAILDRNIADGEATAQRVGGHFWALDVAQEAQWPVVLDAVEERLGPIGYACLNAGVMSRPLTPQLSVPAIDEIPLDTYHQLVSVNINGTYYGLRHLLPRLTLNGGGAITVTSSIAGLRPIPYDPIYAMTKHALVGLVRSLALAHGAGPVRINAICPGGFTSDLFPPELWTDASLSPADVGAIALDMLREGTMGETRVILKKSEPGQVVTPPDITG